MLGSDRWKKNFALAQQNSSLSILLFHRSIESKLPIILEAEDQKNIHDLRNSKVGMNSIWLGGSFLMGSFKWDNEEQTPVSPGFQNWFLGEPDNLGKIQTLYYGLQNGYHYKTPNLRKVEKCMTMSFMGKWSSESCNLKRTVICEKCLTCEENSTSGQ